MPFLNREDELAALEERWKSSRAEFMVIYGRRRIGKTELILHFARDKRHLYFEAASGTENDQLRDLSNLLADVSGRDLFRAQPLTSWAAFFSAVEEELERGPVVIALDEFQFAARQTADLGSQINRFWRRQKENPNLFFILSGSDVSFFEKRILGYSATTYGRRTGGFHMQPFAPRQVELFLPGWKPEELVRAYAVFGGVPYYLEQLRAVDSLEENIWRLTLAPDAPLRDEPMFLFAQQSDLREESIYFSALRAIASGRTRRNEIAQRIGRSGDQAGEILTRLIDMRLVRKVHPVTTPHPDRTKTVRFEISDPFLRFWFSFIHPYRAYLHSERSARRHLIERVAPGLDDFVSAPPFEEICQLWLGNRVHAAAAGRWWGSVKERRHGAAKPVNVSREVDAVAVDVNGSVLAVGSCKWTAGEMQASDKASLERLIPHVTAAGEVPDVYLFARSGFSEELREVARDGCCHLVSVEEVLRG